MDVECCRHVLNQYLRQIAQSHCRDFEVIAIARDLLNSWLAHRHLQALAQSVNFFGGSPASGLSEGLVIGRPGTALGKFRYGWVHMIPRLRAGHPNISLCGKPTWIV